MCGFRFELGYERRTMYYGGAVAAAAQTWKQVVQQIHNNTVDCIIALTALLPLVVDFFSSTYSYTTVQQLFVLAPGSDWKPVQFSQSRVTWSPIRAAVLMTRCNVVIGRPARMALQ